LVTAIWSAPGPALIVRLASGAATFTVCVPAVTWVPLAVIVLLLVVAPLTTRLSTAVVWTLLMVTGAAMLPRPTM